VLLISCVEHNSLASEEGDAGGDGIATSCYTGALITFFVCQVSEICARMSVTSQLIASAGF
jgi:hypothetical protein